MNLYKAVIESKGAKNTGALLEVNHALNPCLGGYTPVYK